MFIKLDLYLQILQRIEDLNVFKKNIRRKTVSGKKKFEIPHFSNCVVIVQRILKSALLKILFQILNQHEKLI